MANNIPRTPYTHGLSTCPAQYYPKQKQLGYKSSYKANQKQDYSYIAISDQNI